MTQRTVLSPSDLLLAQPLSDHVVATTAAPPIMNSFVSLSKSVSGIPCFNCVGSPPSSQAYGIVFSEPYMALGTLVDETYTFQDVSLTATCTIVFKVMQNATTLATYKFTKISVQPGYVYLYYHTSNLPSNAVAGPALISGNILCSGTTTKPITESVYFY